MLVVGVAVVATEAPLHILALKDDILIGLDVGQWGHRFPQRRLLLVPGLERHRRVAGLEPELHVDLPLARDPIEVGVLSRKEGYPVRDEDVAWLSPLIDDHINLLGRYSFTVPESVSRGELRRCAIQQNKTTERPQMRSHPA